jgi:hypothetical protein
MGVIFVVTRSDIQLLWRCLSTRSLPKGSREIGE